MLRRNALLLLFGVGLCLAMTSYPSLPETTVTGVTITPDRVVLDVGDSSQLMRPRSWESSASRSTQRRFVHT